VERSVEFRLNNVSPTPARLRLDSQVDAPANETTVNLGNLFFQYYFDSYGTAAPRPDPSRFEYLNLVSAATDFSFLSFLPSFEADPSSEKNPGPRLSQPHHQPHIEIEAHCPRPPISVSPCCYAVNVVSARIHTRSPSLEARS